MARDAKLIGGILFIVFAICCFLVLFKPSHNKSSGEKPPLYVTTYGMWSEDLSKMSFVAEVLQRNFKIIQDKENYDLVIMSVFAVPDNKLRDGAVRLMWVGEAVSARLDDMDVVIGNEFVDSEKYLRMSIGLCKDLRIGAVHKSLKQNKKFCAFLYSADYPDFNDGNNLYTARKDFFKILSKYKTVDSGGTVLNNIGHQVAHGGTMEWLSNYRFVIAFEGCEFDGYVTEKLFNAYYAGAIPIWAGARSALKGINKKAIIYAGDFASLQELADYVAKVDQDPALYDEIWNQPLVISEESSYEHLTNKLEKKILDALKRKKIIRIDNGVIRLTESAQHEILKRRAASSKKST